MSAIRAIILDFDGVLVESNEEKTRAFVDLFALYPEYSDAMMAYHLENQSTSRMIKFEHYVYKLMNRSGDTKTVDEMARKFSELVFHRVVSCSDVSGSNEFLTEFSKQLPLYVSSATPMDELRRIVQKRGIDSFFVEIYGDPPYKKTEVIRWVLEENRLLPSEVVFIGDAVSDYNAAAECGVKFIGRDSGLPFDGIDIKLYRDLYEIADVIRNTGGY